MKGKTTKTKATAAALNTVVLRELFAKATGVVTGLVSKDNLSPFSRVRLDVVGPNVSLTGSNGDMQLEYRVLGETSESGTLVLPGNLLARFVAAAPEGPVTICGAPSQRVRITCGEGVAFSLAAADGATDYPVMAGPEPGCGSIEMSAMRLKEMLRKVRFAAAPDGSERAQLCGVNMKLEDGLLGMTATDGRRLAHVEGEILVEDDSKAPKFDVTLSNKAVSMLFKLLGDGAEFVTLQADASAVRVVADKWNLTTKVVADKYPAWRNVVPANPEYVAKLGRVEFLEALGRAALAADESTNAVKITLENGKATFEGRSDLSTANIKIACCEIPEGGSMTASYNPRLLQDALGAIDDDEFTLAFTDSRGASLLKCTIPWLAVVMPLRIS